MNNTADAAFTPSHVAPEFLIWLWYTTDREGGSMRLTDELPGFPAPVGMIDIWVEDRIAMRGIDSDSKVAVFTSETAAESRSARTALAEGRLPCEMSMSLRREDREFLFTLSGAALDLKTAALPQVVTGEEEAVVYDRGTLIEELEWVIQALFWRWATERTSASWPSTLARIRSWIESGTHSGEE